MPTEDYFATALALQRHEANTVNAYRRHMAERLRAEADDYELRADQTAEYTDRKELEWISFGLRIAATMVEP